MIGEPHRAFYGNQFGLTFPLFEHYGVELWVPEVGGPIDPRNEAHDLVMCVFGGMSKGERNRIKIRVRAAMAAQAQVEGRFLGGRPPYGYRARRRRPAPQPGQGRRRQAACTGWSSTTIAAPVVARIFAEFLAGRGFFAIAEGLTGDGIPCPSAHDPGRNRHRCGIAWSKSAVRAILTNPRYTGRQVWNKQRKDEVLIDVDDVGLGHVTKLRWNPRGSGSGPTSPCTRRSCPQTTSTLAQAMLAGPRRPAHQPDPQAHRPAPTLLRGLLFCAVCDRRMQGHWINDAPPTTGAGSPRSTPWPTRSATRATSTCAKTAIVPRLDQWLASAVRPRTARPRRSTRSPTPSDRAVTRG